MSQPSSSSTGVGSNHHRGLHDNEETYYGGLPLPPPVMERVLFQLHHRSCQFGLRYLSKAARRVLEHLLLVVAIGGFGAFFLLHRHFVLSVGSLGSMSHANAATLCFTSIPGIDKSADIHRVIILPPTSRIAEPTGTPQKSYLLGEEGSETCVEANHVRESRISFSFSTTKAFLMLPSNHTLLQERIVRSQTLLVGPHDPNCFGEPFFQFLIHNIVGYETIVWNWALGYLFQQSDVPQKAFVLSHKKGRIQDLDLPIVPEVGSRGDDRPPRWLPFLSARRNNTFEVSRLNLLSKTMVVFKTTFLFLFCTTLISFTLRETQERMLEFTQELSRRVSVQLPLVDLIVFHLIHNLVFVPIMVGMMFFLIEFYSGDRLLAFLVMSIVWCVEVFSVISLRSYQGITFFPRMFFLLFSLFHIYFFANPFGFAYVALWVVCLFMLHSMAFFWHRYELPAVANGRVTIDRPRQHYDDHHRGTSPPGGGGFGSSSQSSAPISVPSHHGIRNSARQIMPILHLESPPQIRHFQGHVDFEPVNLNEQLQATTTNQLADSSGQGRGHIMDHNGNQLQPSFSSQVSTSSRNSATSSHNVFREDEEDSSSFVYFMQGEVVMRRGQQQQNDIRSGHAEAMRNVESAHTLASTTSGHDLQQQQYQHHVQERQQNGWVPSVASTATITQVRFGHSISNVGLDLLDQQAEGQFSASIIYSSPTSETFQSTNGQTGSDGSRVVNESLNNDFYGGDDSMGGLQSILEVRLTPRHRNGGGDELSRGLGRVSPPIFPDLPP